MVHAKVTGMVLRFVGGFELHRSIGCLLSNLYDILIPGYDLLRKVIAYCSTRSMISNKYEQ